MKQRRKRCSPASRRTDSRQDRGFDSRPQARRRSVTETELGLWFTYSMVSPWLARSRAKNTAPQAWQRVMHQGTPDRDTNVRSILAAQRMFPDVSLLVSVGSRKLDNGLCRRAPPRGVRPPHPPGPACRMNHQSIEARLGELIPRDALRQLVALLEECKRRAQGRARIPKEIRLTLELDERTGEVVEAEVPRRYGRER